MRILLLVFGLLITSLFPAAAQISVDVSLDEMEFVRDESMFVKVRIKNQSGQTLKLGQDAGWLTFNVQSQDGPSVEKISDVPVTGEFTVDSSQTATKTVNLMPYFSFPQPGRYLVSAVVKMPQWNDDFHSPVKTFHITRGVRIWDQEFGVPRKEGEPEMRLYSLVKATGMKSTRLYARVSDREDNHVFRVVPLGKVVSFGKPETQVDRSSRLHVLFQNGPRSFSYDMITPAGEWVTRHAYDYAETRPVLRVNDTGTVIVAGGIRRFAETDFPSAISAGTTDLTNTPAIPTTNGRSEVPATPLKNGTPTRP